MKLNAAFRTIQANRPGNMLLKRGCQKSIGCHIGSLAMLMSPSAWRC
jgi:hypothetical protein